MKLWSNATGDKLSSAESKLVASKHKFNEIAIEIYTALNANLMKIEYAREYLAKAQQYRQRMDALLDKMNIASKFGIMKRSDRLFADVSIKKFDESVLNVQSQIEQYVSLINTFIKKLYRPDYGLSKNYLHEALSMSGEMFSINNILQRNFSVLNRRADLTAAKYDTLGYNENAILELVTQHGIEEHRLTSTKNADNQAVYGYSYDDDGSAYIGLKFTYTGLNFQSNQNKRSEYNLYSKKVIEFDAFLHDLFVKLKTQKQQYELVSKRIESIEKQIQLTTNVISSLLKEMAVDEANAMDLFRNISSLSDLEMNRLSTLNELIDLVTNIKSINAVILNIMSFIKYLKPLFGIILTGAAIYFVVFTQFDVVSEGEGVLAINDSNVNILSPSSGTIKKIFVTSGDDVENQQLLTINNIEDENKKTLLDFNLNFYSEQVTKLARTHHAEKNHPRRKTTGRIKAS